MMSVFSRHEAPAEAEAASEQNQESIDVSRPIYQWLAAAKRDSPEERTTDLYQAFERPKADGRVQVPEYILPENQRVPVISGIPREPAPRVDLAERLEGVERPDDSREITMPWKAEEQPKEKVEPKEDDSTEVITMPISTKRFSFQALKHVVPSVRQKLQPLMQARQRIADAYVLANVKLGSFHPAMAASWLKETYHNPNTKRAAKYGAVALAGIGLVAGSALATKGILHNVNNGPIDAMVNIVPKNTHSVHEAVASVQPPVHTSRALHETLNQNINVTVKHSQGITQVIAEKIPGKKPDQYYNSVKEAIHKFGPGILKGVRHYKMANGDIGVDAGKAHMNHKIFQFFTEALKAKQ